MYGKYLYANSKHRLNFQNLVLKFCKNWKYQDEARLSNIQDQMLTVNLSPVSVRRCLTLSFLLKKVLTRSDPFSLYINSCHTCPCFTNKIYHCLQRG